LLDQECGREVEHDHDGGDHLHERAIGAVLEPAGRERQQEVDEQ
jgi:hypothetical protein